VGNGKPPSDTGAADSSPGKSRTPMDALAYVAGRTFIPVRPNGRGKLSHAVKWGIRYVLNNYAHNFTITDLAGTIGLTNHYFTRKFHKETGITPGAFLQRYRITQAMNMLVRSEQPVRRIASNVGYTDHAAFTRAFGRITGTQPTMYRLTRHGT